MNAFCFSQAPLDPPTPIAAALADPAAGGYAAFEGWVRNHNEGHAVTRLEYEAFEALANKEGERIVAEAIARFGVTASGVRASRRLARNRRPRGVGRRQLTRIATRRSRPAATSSTK